MHTPVRYCPESDRRYPGVPARDLTAEEWQAVPEAVRTALIAQGVYEIEQPAGAVTPDGEEEEEDG